MGMEITAAKVSRPHLGHPVSAQVAVPGEPSMQVRGTLAWFTQTTSTVVLALNDEDGQAIEWEFALSAPVIVEIGYQGSFRP